MNHEPLGVISPHQMWENKAITVTRYDVPPRRVTEWMGQFTGQLLYIGRLCYNIYTVYIICIHYIYIMWIVKAMDLLHMFPDKASEGNLAEDWGRLTNDFQLQTVNAGHMDCLQVQAARLAGIWDLRGQALVILGGKCASKKNATLGRSVFDLATCMAVYLGNCSKTYSKMNWFTVRFPFAQVLRPFFLQHLLA